MDEEEQEASESSDSEGAPWSDEEEDTDFEECSEELPPNGRIEQLAEAMREETSRLLEDAGKEGDAGADGGMAPSSDDDGAQPAVKDDDEQKDTAGNDDEPKEPFNNSGDLSKSLANLIVLWEQRLTNTTQSRNAVSETTNGESTVVDTLPTTIDTSDQNDMSVVSNEPASPVQSPRWFSFGSPRKRAEAAKSQDLERMVQERDEKIYELEAVISSNIDIIEQMKKTIEHMAGAISSPEKIASLQKALLAQIDKEHTAASLREIIQTKALSSVVEDESEQLRSEISNLQDSVTDLESTVSLQKTQQDTLKSELARLKNTVDEGIDLNSHQEDKIETLKSALMKLELMYQHMDYDRRQMEESMRHKVENRDMSIAHLQKTHQEKVDLLEKCNSEQEDEIEKLKADLTKLQLRYDLMKEEKERFEEETNAKMEEMNLKVELADLEGSTGHDISQSM